MSEHELTRWLKKASSSPQTPPAALGTAGLVAGAVHRLAWEGPDDRGDRERARRWLVAASAVLCASSEEEDQALGAVLDWWRAAALGDREAPFAYATERLLPTPDGERLRAILDSPLGRPLDAVQRPVAFERVCKTLEQQSQRNPGKIAADKPIYAKAIKEYQEILRAAREKQPFPSSVRLADATDDDLQALAAEAEGGHRLVRNSPLHAKVLRALEQGRALVQRARDLWPGQATNFPRLSEGWRDRLRTACGTGAAIAIALLEDAEKQAERSRFDEVSFLAALERGPGELDRKMAFVLGREAVFSLDRELPPWIATIHERESALREQLERHEEADDVEEAGALENAYKALEELDLDEADSWLEEAREARELATRGADLDRGRERALARAEQLARLGRPVSGEGPDTQAWVSEVDAAFREARRELEGRVQQMRERSRRVGGDREAVDAALSRAQVYLPSDLAETAKAVEAAQAALAETLEAERARLGEARWGLVQRLDRLEPAIAEAVATGIERAAARAEVGLDASRLEADLRGLVDALVQGQPVAVVGSRGAAAIVWAGIAAPGPAREGAPADADARVRRWGTLGAPPEGEGPVFREEGLQLTGPWRFEDARLKPATDHGGVARIPRGRFEALFGVVQVGSGLPRVPAPPSFEELRAAGARVEEGLDDDALAERWAEALEGAPSAEAIRRWLEVARAAAPPELRADREARFTTLLARAERLAEVRAEGVQAWLQAESGAEAIAAAADRLVDRESEAIRARIQAKEAELGAVEARLAASAELLEDAKARLLIEVLGPARPASRAAESSSPASSSTPDEARRPTSLDGTEDGQGGAPEIRPVRAAPFSPRPVAGLAELVGRVAGDTWDPAEVANLILSLATGRWTLLAGLPGVGKSTFVRSVLTRMGHGPSTERCLELVVRRDWHDDAPLFGFWHPSERRWMPSSEGFIEHLLRAADGAESDGVWPVMVEELNLASPEHYLARMISAFEAPEPSVRLYDADLGPLNAARYPPACQVADAVRVLGTVNVDDTVERLSPRFLSRASVIWIEPTAEPPAWRPEDDRMDLAVPWSVLGSLRGEAPLGPVSDLVRYLQAERLPGAPTTRTLRVIGRYLFASSGVLDPIDAQDRQVLQRILPPLRGVGAGWRRRLEELTRRFDDAGWVRSAAKARELRERGEELGDWYDFFHT